MNVLVSKEELLFRLHEQLKFIRTSSEAYDRGDESEARRLALAIRILVHDTKKSTSLLTSLGVKDYIFYFDHFSIARITDNPKPLLETRVGFQNTGNGWKYIFLESDPEYTSTFSEWWNNLMIFGSSISDSFSRADIVLIVANQDGGGHVDPQLESRYYSLSRQNLIGWETSKGILNGPELPIVRQAAEEIERSILSQLRDIQNRTLST